MIKYLIFLLLITASASAQPFTLGDPALLATYNTTSSGPPFSPTNLSGCQLFLEADLITGLSDGASVNTWFDFSGHGNNATSCTINVTLEPVPVYKVAIQNGQPIVRFNGGVVLSNSYPILSGASTVIVIAHKTGGTGLQELVETTPTLAAIRNLMFARDATDKWGVYINSEKFSSFDCNTWQIMASVSDGVITGTVTNILYTGLNAGEVVTDTGRYAGDAFSRVGIGADTGGSLSDLFIGDMFSVLIYNRALTAGEITQVANYYKSKLGI